MCGECEAQSDRLVLETLAPVSKDRKCFRLINGVLVERTVEDVVPALQTNADGLKNVLDGLVKEYKKKQDEMETWKASLTLPAPYPRPPLPHHGCLFCRTDVLLRGSSTRDLYYVGNVLSYAAGTGYD